MNRFRVTISAGQANLHMLWTAIAAQHAGVLSHYVTSLYVTEGQSSLLLNPLVRGAIGSRRADKLRLHHKEGLDPGVVRLVFSAEFAFRLLNRLGSPIGRLWAAYRDQAFALPMEWYGWRSQRFAEGADLFHVRSGFGRYAMKRARDGGAICLVDQSIADSEFLERVSISEQERWDPRNSRSTVSRKAMKHIDQDLVEADYVVVNSQFVRKTLLAANRVPDSKIRVLNYGVDTERFAPGPRSAARSKTEPFTVLFVGGIDYRKGVLYLLEAFKRLRLTNARLVLIGSPGNIPLSRYAGLYTHIPFLPQPELVAWYNAASVIVFPSLAEGSARVTMEAMACARPVITTPESGSLVRDGIDGFVVPSRDIDALADRIAWAAGHRESAIEMGSSGRRLVEAEFTWNHYQSRLLELYYQLCAPVQAGARIGSRRSGRPERHNARILD